jgi:hypothetical protein
MYKPYAEDVCIYLLRKGKFIIWNLLISGEYVTNHRGHISQCASSSLIDFNLIPALTIGEYFYDGCPCEAGHAYHFGESVITTGLLFLLNLLLI